MSSRAQKKSKKLLGCENWEDEMSSRAAADPRPCRVGRIGQGPGPAAAQLPPRPFFLTPANHAEVRAPLGRYAEPGVVQVHYCVPRRGSSWFQLADSHVLEPVCATRPFDAPGVDVLIGYDLSCLLSFYIWKIRGQSRQQTTGAGALQVVPHAVPCGQLGLGAAQCRIWWPRGQVDTSFEAVRQCYRALWDPLSTFSLCEVGMLACWHDGRLDATSHTYTLRQPSPL